MGLAVGGYGTAVSALLLLDRGLWMLLASDFESPQYGFRESSEKVPQDLSHRQVQQLRSVFHAVLCQRMLACSPDLKDTQG